MQTLRKYNDHLHYLLEKLENTFYEVSLKIL